MNSHMPPPSIEIWKGSLTPMSEETNQKRISFEQLIVAIRSDELDANTGYRILFNALIPYLYSVIRNKVGEQADDTISELVSVTLEEVWKGLRTYEPDKGSFTSWVSTIAHRRSIDYFRRINRAGEVLEVRSLDEIVDPQADPNRRLPQPVNPTEPLDDLAAKDAQNSLLKELLKNISDLDRDIYLLKTNYDLTFEELEQVFNESGYNVTRKGIEARYYRTKQQLLSAYKAKFG